MKKQHGTTRDSAIAFLRSRNLYILDRGSARPRWGNGLRVTPALGPVAVPVVETFRRLARSSGI